MQDGVFWSSRLEYDWPIWIWSVLIYKDDGPSVAKHGWAITKNRGRKNLNAYLISQGETP